MILNREQYMGKTYKCGRKIMEHLVLNCHLPLLSVEGDTYYFADTEELRKCIKELPITLKLASIWQNK